MLLSILLCSDAPAASIDDDADDLVDVWELRCVSPQVLGEAPHDIVGRNPKGYLIFTPEGRMMTIIMPSDRTPATTVEEQAALRQSIVDNCSRGPYLPRIRRCLWRGMARV